jgi:fumarylacetoacetase
MKEGAVPRPSWLPIPADHPFGAQTLPYGSFARAEDPDSWRVGVAVGDLVLDLTGAAPALLPAHAALFAGGTLDALLGAGPAHWAAVRAAVTALVTDPGHREQVAPHLVAADAVTLQLPFTVADYVDFYASEHHATNLGRIFRPDSPPLTPNWRHLPIGYHGRAGTVVVSGTPIRRPYGQSRAPGATAPDFGPSARLDIEAELGFVVGVPSALGSPVPVGRFADHVFGVCLVNDWSARDLQAWEYVPLGPFLGKSFATSLSPWVVPLAALGDARVRVPSRDTELLPYLRETEDRGLDVELAVRLNGHLIAEPSYRYMHWSPAQMLAHLTVNGASLRTGDLYASGTVSGPGDRQRGSLIELTTNGSQPLRLPDGSTRQWLADGDEVAITAVAATADGRPVGFGSVTGRVYP